MAPNPKELAVASAQAPSLPMIPALPDAFRAQLTLHGINPDEIAIPRVPFHWKVSWSELCTIPTRDIRTMASPLCLITNVVEMPEAVTDYPDYVGMIRIEFTTEDMAELAVTHSRCYAETGEFLPLTEFMRAQRVPFVCRFGFIETRKQGRHVVRALPTDIPLG